MTQITLTVIAKGPNKWASNDTMETDSAEGKKSHSTNTHDALSFKYCTESCSNPSNSGILNISDIQKYPTWIVPI